MYAYTWATLQHCKRRFTSGNNRAKHSTLFIIIGPVDALIVTKSVLNQELRSESDMLRRAKGRHGVNNVGCLSSAANEKRGQTVTRRKRISKRITGRRSRYDKFEPEVHFITNVRR